MPADNTFLRKTIEKALRDLPAMPTIVLRVLEETDKPDVEIKEVERLIASDQALAMKVLRVVNSAYYGLPRQVASINQSIVILGVQQIRNLVLSIAAAGVMKPKNKAEEQAMRRFWVHSYSAAAVAKRLGKIKNISAKEQELVFVAGLLHDIGKLFLFIHFGDTYNELVGFAIEDNVTLEKAETQYLGMSHADVAGEMARAWNLPEPLIDVIAGHETYIPAPEEQRTLSLVQYADYCCKHLYYEEGQTPVFETSEPVLRWLGLTSENAKEIEATVAECLEEARELMGAIAA